MMKRKVFIHLTVRFSPFNTHTFCACRGTMHRALLDETLWVGEQIQLTAFQMSSQKHVRA